MSYMSSMLDSNSSFCSDKSFPHKNNIWFSL